jgi:hypothetical protein
VDWAERAIVAGRKVLQQQTPEEDLSDVRFVVERDDDEG